VWWEIEEVLETDWKYNQGKGEQLVLLFFDQDFGGGIPSEISFATGIDNGGIGMTFAELILDTDDRWKV